ncbi:UNVERIFIED_CONTAM: Histone-lysine N-methyltransferase ATXR3 [Sesamum latifolium]|uniref:Histone-lysine N-methyltransferase ATXR3 n=1 Tax=Sesamum latifolium TaxID=2727402 RepID=A0AAW2WW00_9LAMI
MEGDADGYDLVVVDAMHKANYASRICHSCRPNCEAKVTAVHGQYQIGIYSVRPIAYGEEITFDYNSVTESKEEYEASVCLCGNQVCRGSYLNLTGEGAFQKVLKEHHGLLDRHSLLLEACELNSVSEEDYIDLGKAGLGSCLLGGLPDWLIAYTARLVRFINFERTKLPSEIFRHNTEEKRRYFAEIHLEVEKSDAEIQEKQPQRPWPKDRIWSFKSSTKVVGSPMLDAVLHKATIDKEMVHWLKHRPPIYQAMWDS